MSEIKNQQVTPRDRAKSLFFILKKQFGRKYPTYPQRIKNHFKECQVQQLEINGISGWIGLIEEDHLVTIYFFTERPESFHHLNDIVAVRVNGGKLSPEMIQQYFVEIMYLHAYQETPFGRHLSLSQIISELGPVTQMEPSLEELEERYSCYNLSFDAEFAKKKKHTSSIAY